MGINKFRAKMKHGKACVCDGPFKDKLKKWKVTECHIIQNKTSSRCFSGTVNCGICGRVWKTWAKYLDLLTLDATSDNILITTTKD